MNANPAATRNCLLAYALAWIASVAYLAATGGDWGFPLVSMAIFGITGSGLVLVLTRHTKAPAVPVRRPVVELGAVLAYLLVYATVFLGPVMAWTHSITDPRSHDIVTALVKLTAHVLLPVLLLLALRAPVRTLFDSGIERRGFWPVLLVVGGALIGLLAVVSPSLKQVAATGATLPTLLWAVPLNFVAISIVAGLNEEFLYRAVLQSRLAAVLRSPAGAIPVASIIFALAHWPGLYLRGGPGTDGWSTDPWQVAAFTIATLSPLSLMLGTAWWRTRSLLLVAALHGSVDFLPSLADFITTWAR
ncbi:CPBP family intramembrane metalloprotease [Polymorphobacter arshaanensis]|uniref:CPBP family intramembrane metalloprotease n=1 Tax=Glacieibacterium arshaanense TaxID=2511025 RepID=A0A4Y9EQ67_9SPHN|nr:CPBP family intramembrane glutamic endopeptidase [Polymorphobacter arshaanensis]TFU05746.1 CPBP family intramembrane metalloprotease [Polymorphobacter arshaanensis]